MLFSTLIQKRTQVANAAGNVKNTLFSAMTIISAFSALASLSGASTSGAEQTWNPEDFRLGSQETPVEVSVEKMVVPDMGPGEAPTLRIESDTKDYEFSTIELGRLPVSSDTTYQAVYYVLANVEESTDGLYLMIREHASESGPPLNRDYHKSSVFLRSIRPGNLGHWEKRKISFTTGSDTRFLSAAEVVQPFKGRMNISPVQLLPGDENSSEPFEKGGDEIASLEALREAASRRQPLITPPLIFSRSQIKYDLGKNYYHTWLDRPLMNSRDFRNSAQASFTEMAKESKRYGLDGLAFFPETKGRMAVFDMTEQGKVEGFQLLPEILIYDTEHPIETAAAAIQRAIKNPQSVRINGKVLFSGYASENFTPVEWKKMLGELRATTGPFLFVPSLSTATGKIRAEYLAGLPITQKTVENAQAFLRSYLDVCDGIYFSYPPAFQNKDGTFDTEFYRDICIPIFKSVLREPKYKDKLLGLSAYKAHFNPDVGRGKGFLEDLTRTLRSTLSVALDAHPDFVVLPEWDEFNENTSFMPTIYGSTTSRRIIRSLTSRTRGTPLEPAAGDDVSLPNLILSSRKIVTLGEILSYELLNVPDSSVSGEYSVQLSLRDEDAKLVKQFDPVTFKKDELSEHRLSIPTEELPRTVALIPQLVIKGYGDDTITLKEGFHHVQIRATWNWDYLAVKQPIREILKSRSATLTASAPRPEDGSFLLTATADMEEEIILAEVVGDDDEVYAYDKGDEYSRGNEDKDLVMIELRSTDSIDVSSKFQIQGSPVKWLTDLTILHQDTGTVNIQGSTIEYRGPISPHQRWIYIALDEDKRQDAIILVRIGDEEYSLPVAEVLDQKLLVHSFKNGVQAAFYPYRKQVDLPVSLNQKTLAFDVRVWPEVVTEQYHLQLTTASGKVYRSGPVLVPWATKSEATILRIYSDKQKKGLDVSVRKNRIPNIEYEFSPKHGDVLQTHAGRAFIAALGGLTDVTTGQGTAQMRFWIKDGQAAQLTPRWCEESSGWDLEFDGRANFLLMPREVIPRHSSFTVTMEVKPRGNADQTLLAGNLWTLNPSFALFVRHGLLKARFIDEDWTVREFAVDLPIPAGTWNRLEVRYDFNQMVFNVNGEERSFPCSHPGRNDGLSLVGPGMKMSAFDGWLRKLTVRHNGLSHPPTAAVQGALIK